MALREQVVGLGAASAPVSDVVLALGPHHPSTHGVLQLALVLDGDVVVSADPVVGFLHRGAEKLFEGSGHTLAEVLKIADEGKAVPHFPLPTSMKATVAVDSQAVESQNVVGVVKGSDPALADEYVVLSAHLDHVGVGAAINGDSIYNGAMDNASGIATLIESAKVVAAARPKTCGPSTKSPWRGPSQPAPSRSSPPSDTRSI